MEEGQERDTSPDDQGHIIDDDDNEDSPTNTPDVWMTERNEKDTKFVRVLTDAIPNKKHQWRQCRNSRLFKRGKIFQRTGEGWYGHTGCDWQTLSVTDKYFRDVVCDTNWQKNTVTFQHDNQWERFVYYGERGSGPGCRAFGCSKRSSK